MWKLGALAAALIACHQPDQQPAQADCSAQDTVSIVATATGEPQPIPHAIFPLEGIEEHFHNPAYAQACGLP